MSQHPTLTLEQVSVLVTNPNPRHNLFHTFGLFKQELSLTGGTFWGLYDEFKNELHIELTGSITDYPRPKPADIIRIHRLKVDTVKRVARVTHPRNVIVWPAFQYNPTPITIARSPTICVDDINRRRTLESYFTTKITRIKEIIANRATCGIYYNVAGRVNNSVLDSYGHREIDFTDGTGKFVIRVFAKKQDNEDDRHFIEAEKLRIGDLFVATNVKIDKTRTKVDLSANLYYGRSLRSVESTSILGQSIREMIGPDGDLNHHDDQPCTSSQTQNNSSTPEVTRLRRSSRLNDGNSHDCNHNESNVDLEEQNLALVESYSSSHSTGEPAEDIPPYTKFSEFQKEEDGKFQFYDVAGQVRGEAHETSLFNNYVFQLYDGSKHNHSNHHLYEIKDFNEGCLIIYVYSKQKDSDTNEHFEKAKSLKEGDLVFIRNLKVTFKQGKIKLEMSANKSHNKSINVIDKNSNFGIRILDDVENPYVEELAEEVDLSSMSQNFDEDNSFS